MARPMDRRSFLAHAAAMAAGVVGITAAGDLLFMEGPFADGMAGAVTNGAGRNGISVAKPKRADR